PPTIPPPPPPAPTPPMVAVLRPSISPTTPRTYLFPEALENYAVPTEPIGLSLVADIDQGAPPSVEMVVAMRGDPFLVSLGLLQLRDDGFRPISIVAIGAESPRNIRALAFDRAFPATPLSGERKGVFIVHETDIDSSTERRLSTLLVAPGAGSEPPRLLPPDAGNTVGFGIENLVGGNFHEISVTSGRAKLDLALAQRAPDEIVLIKNDGFGGFPAFSNRLPFAGLLPDSLTLLPSPPSTPPQFDRLLFCGNDSRVGVWLRDEPTPDPGPELPDALSPPVWPGVTLSDRTRLQVGDVDGDGHPDLVVLLSVTPPAPSEGGARLALLRGGKVVTAADPFPFHMPTTLTPVHGNASSITLGDFRNAGTGQPRRLELAVAVPVGTTATAQDGNHVRFFRYVAGASPQDDHFEPSAVPNETQVLVAGSAPTLIVSGDFDRDGLVDLLLACEADNTLRLFRNTAPVTIVPGHVDVGAFEEGLTSPRPLAPGMPTALRLSDVNGDGSLDCVVWVEFTSTSGVRSTTVASYLSSGAGEFVGPRFASPTRIGNRDATLSGDLGDWNRDGLPDLLLGWNTSAIPNDINLRVMFGGTR
ncbi:MAG TPA: VCBS repeat-containing protein, partial [Planctomycetota bacterium]